MSTLKVTNIESPSGGGVSAKINDIGGGQLSNRNLIINGAMQVAQRSTSATGVTSIGYHAVDRIESIIQSMGTYTVSQSTDAPSGFSKSFKYEVTTAETSPTANAQCAIQYTFEGQDLQLLDYGANSAKSMTLSFWVKSNVTGVYSNEFFQDDNSLRNYIFSYTINAANTWEYKTVTIPGDTSGIIDDDNTEGLTLKMYQAAGSSFTSGTFSPGSWASRTKENVVSSASPNLADTIGNTWQITGVQLEVGDLATSFEHRSYDDELKRCYRYYYKVVPGNGAMFGPLLQYDSADGVCYIDFPVTMRTPVSALEQTGSAGDYKILYGTGSAVLSTVPLYGGDPSQFSQTVIFRVSSGAAGAAGDAGFGRSNAAGAYLAWSAEL